MEEAKALGLSDEILLRRWADGRDREAADLLIRRHEAALYAFCLRVAGSEGEASEAVQESFLRVLQLAGRFRGSSTVRTWIFGIAVNVLRSRRFRWLRLRSLFRPLGAEEVPMTQDRASEANLQELLSRLARAVEELPRSSRVPVLLHYYEGMRYEEIAEVLGCPAGTVASRLNAARKRLEKILRRSGADLAAIAAMPLLARTVRPRAPSVLIRSLRRLPESALVPAAAATAAALAAKALVGLGAVLVLGTGASFLVPEIFGGKDSRDGALLAEAAGSREKAHADRYVFQENCAQELLRAAARVPVRGASPSPPAPPRGSSQRFSIHFSGFVRDGDSGGAFGCAQVRLSTVWNREGEAGAIRAETVADSAGYFEIGATALPAGIYAVSFVPPEGNGSVEKGAVAVPHGIDLRRDLSASGDFFVGRASAEESDILLQPYRADLIQQLKDLWQEEGLPMVSVRVSAPPLGRMQAALFDEWNEQVDPLVQVYEPIRGELLLGPAPPGRARAEFVLEEVGFAVLPALAVPRRGLLQAAASISGGTEFLSAEVRRAAGEPLSGALVELAHARLWSGLSIKAARTDSKGRVCFEDLPFGAGPVNLRVFPREPQGLPTVVCEVPQTRDPVQVVVE